MTNVLDYLRWRGDLSFEASPFCEIDNLILSMLSFIDYKDIVPESKLGMPKKLSECYEENRKRYPKGEKFGEIIPDSLNELFELAANSKRFSSVYVTAYSAEFDEENYMQFAAVTFILPDNSLFAAFRGTDDTLVGWREDFNLSFTHPVRSQTKAVEYLTDTASVFSGPIRTGGHSKGGHLAVYSAVFSPNTVRDRIITAYSNDGPGFMEGLLEREEFAEMKDKIVTYVPQSSVIGMLLCHSEDYRVIESTIENGLLQHDPFSWSVMGDHFIHLDSLSDKGRRNNEVIKKWLSGLSGEKRKIFTDALFNVLDSTGSKTVTDLGEGQIAKIGMAIRAMSELDRESKDVMNEFIRRLIEANLSFRNEQNPQKKK